MKCLVTGGAGFIGSHLCEGLLREGHNVISVDNYIAGKSANLERIKYHPQFTEVFADINDTGKMNLLLKGVDVVFHQAASKKNVCERSPVMDLEVNARGTLHLLELCLNHGVKKFVHASTGSVYGEAVGVQDENHPLNPASYYGVSKLAGEKYVQLFHKLHGMNTTIFRYFHVYGSRQDDSTYGGVVSIFDKNLREGLPLLVYGDGTQQRSFTHVDDVVRANLLSIYDKPGQIYNCASAIKVTINELVDIMKGFHGKPEHEVIYKDWLNGDIKCFNIDNSKIRRELGINFTTDIYEGLEKTIKDITTYYTNRA